MQLTRRMEPANPLKVDSQKQLAIPVAGRYAAPRNGRLAQLVERFVYTEDVGGSSPSSPTTLRLRRLRVARHSPSKTQMPHTVSEGVRG